MEMAIALGTQVVLMAVYYAIPIHSIAQNAGFVTSTMDSSSPKIYAVTPIKGSFPLKTGIASRKPIVWKDAWSAMQILHSIYNVEFVILIMAMSFLEISAVIAISGKFLMEKGDVSRRKVALQAALNATLMKIMN
jgi:hypothetical protein